MHGRLQSGDCASEHSPNFDEPIVFTRPTAKMCMTCANGHGEPPWADSPLKAYCTAYPREEGLRKPSSVYYDGADCEFFKELKG